MPKHKLSAHATDEEKLQYYNSRREEIEQDIKALKSLDLSPEGEDVISQAIGSLSSRYHSYGSRVKRLIQRKEGPWMDEGGRINKGDYEGFYIIPLLQALASSAKDFPTAMHKIAQATGDEKMDNMEFTMRPHMKEDLSDPDAYGYLMDLAPNENWELTQDIHWDT